MRRIKSYIILFVLILALRPGWAGEGPVAYPLEKNAVRSSVFSVLINGKPVFVQAYKDIHYLRFAQKGNVLVQVRSLQEPGGWELSPKQLAGKSAVSGTDFKFQLDRPGHYVISLNNKERLFILSDAWELPVVRKNWINVMAYQPDTSGRQVNTSRLQQAINEAARNKQTLYFPAGVYLTGALRLPSYSDIYLEAGALIKASSRPEDFPVDAGRRESDQVHDKEHYTDNGEWMTFSRLIFIDSARHVRLRGQGTIDGSGSVLRPQGKPANLLRIRNSSDVTIEGLLLRDPACWNTHILHSEHVTIRNVKLINDRDVANTDGFDPDASRNVLIDHCFAYCSDDNVAIKTTNNSGLLADCDSITIQHCLFLTKKSALKLGTETKGKLMQHISFLDNYVLEADRGIVLYCYDGARFQHIKFVRNYFEKGYADNQKKAIHFQIRNRSGAGQIEDVLVQDCHFSDQFHARVDMTGLDSLHAIRTVRFVNLRLGDRRIMNTADLGIDTGKFVYDLRFSQTDTLGSGQDSEAFKVFVNGKAAQTIAYKDFHYAGYVQNGKTVIKIVCAQQVRQFSLSPRSRQIPASLQNGQTVTFQPRAAGYFVLTVNGKDRLFLFGDTPKETPVSNIVRFIDVGNAGAEVSTAALQRAINETAAQGKTLVIPKGLYRSGALYLPSHARIFFESGAILKASDELKDFETADHQRARGFINILDASQVQISGYGVIDGNGRALRDLYGDRARIRLVFVQGSSQVSINDIIQRDPGSWNTQIRYSHHVRFDHVKQLNDADLPNTDGFDPDASSYIDIQNCFGYCGDDNVAIKITEDKGPADSVSNIVIKGCVFLTRKSSLKVGTESRGRVIKNILFENNDVIQSDRGIALYCSDGALYKNIIYNNNRFEENYPDAKKMPIHIVINKRNANSAVGAMRDIRITNCKFYQPFPNTSQIEGLDEQHTIALTIRNLIIGDKKVSQQDLNTKFTQLNILE